MKKTIVSVCILGGVLFPAGALASGPRVCDLEGNCPVEPELRDDSFPAQIPTTVTEPVKQVPNIAEKTQSLPNSGAGFPQLLITWIGMVFLYSIIKGYKVYREKNGWSFARGEWSYAPGRKV